MNLLVMAGMAAAVPFLGATDNSNFRIKADVDSKISDAYPALYAFYTDLHQHPELSHMEKETSAKIASALRAAGFQVTEKFGGYGVVGVLKNGPGPTLLIRSELDALPVLEDTGLPYASKVHILDSMRKDVPVAHACGHDLHMTILIGTAQMLSALRDQWSGTLILIGQPAEEDGPGATLMINAGLYKKFPKPDYAIALHDSAKLPAGIIGIREGYVMANVDTAEITVHGVGGHGAVPDATKDPIVLAAKIILALQTIVSREISPLDSAVVTVGSIQGGNKANVIPDEVQLKLTLRSYSDEVQAHIIGALRRICRGEAMAAGLPENLLPTVKIIEEDSNHSLYNDPDLTRKLKAVFEKWFGPDRVQTVLPEMISEDFGEFGRTAEGVPLCMFRLGAVDPAKVAESTKTGVPLPSLHSSKFAPLPEPTLKAGIAAMAAAALDLLKK